jgi:8-oxo-dGTP pyrophosphatase MutT (NUDIX family)/GNAT superfamily N-acetyltransferase
VEDADDLWRIFHAVVAGRDTYAFAPDTPRKEALAYWLDPDVTGFVAEAGGRVAGMYKLIPNRRDLGDHVSNASFMVHPDAGGRGVGRAMGMHALREARVQGYEAMQFNFVVSTNAKAVALWQSLGFEITGTSPKAFRHGHLGLVDAFVMHRSLADIVPVFSEDRRVDDARVRHCAYVVVGGPNDPSPQVVLVRARDDILLPGGGLDAGEDHATAALREVGEECALRVRLAHDLGAAVQFVGGRDGKPVVEKRGRFFSGVVDTSIANTPDHEVLWLHPEDARRMTTNESHRWAIRRWQRLNM